uniref:Homeobox protein VENTX n=1 Tax=Geotrypetes seraphini TaxID=260995 RepID=A0A6P8QP89_GEOSA|nr:homeobox protein VENTX [Geotrypetes seraphini]
MYDGSSARTLRPEAQGYEKGRRSPEKLSLEEQDSSGERGTPARAGASQEFQPQEDASARPRTKFSVKQLRELERSFQEHRYIGASEKRQLAKVLKLSEIQIKTWFQNRRMKFKRQTQDARVEAFFTSVLQSRYTCPEHQAPACPAQRAFSAPPCSLPTCNLRYSLLTPQPFLSVPGSFYSNILKGPLINEPKQKVRYAGEQCRKQLIMQHIWLHIANEYIGSHAVARNKNRKICMVTM